MKYTGIEKSVEEAMSHPVRGAWIEMFADSVTGIESSLSHPVRGAWIEMSDGRFFN